MQILSSFTYPNLYVVPNLYEFLSSVKHKRRYLEEHGQPNRPKAPLTSIVGKKIKNTMEFNGALGLFVAHFLLNIFFCV